MAEVTSNSKSMRANLTSGETKMEEDTDAFKAMGSLSFHIDNFREFTKRPSGLATVRHCDATVTVRGLNFGLAIYTMRCTSKDPTKESMGMGVIVKCENASGCNVNGDGSWSCLASMTQRIKTVLSSGKDDIYEYTHEFFSSKEKSSLEWVDDQPWRFDALLDPENGFYDEKEDVLELVVEIAVDAPDGIMELPKMDSIQLNKQTVSVNKNQLALHSRYFNSLFYNGQFTEGQSGVYEVEIEPPATVEHFKRMLDTLPPMNKPLDDECLEGVLHVANQFLVTVVEGKCLKFLTETSTKPALFKYRVADKYGCTALKNHVLRNLKVADFKDEMFKANMAEYVQLGPCVAETLMSRYDELFPPKSDE